MAVMYFFASVALTLGLPSVLTLFTRKGRKLGLTALAVFTVGAIGTCGYAMLLVFFRAMVVEGAIKGAAFADVSEDTGLLIFLQGWVACFYVGILLLAWRSSSRRSCRAGCPPCSSPSCACSRSPPSIGRVGTAVQVLALAVAFTGIAMAAVPGDTARDADPAARLLRRMGGMTSRPQPKRTVRAWLSDMDGVLVHEEEPIPGAADFIARLTATGRPFLLLTNNSIYTPRDLKARLHRSGIDVPEDAIWTSALATAQFLDDQRPGGSAYVIGEAGLTTAMHEIGYVLSEREPEYVVLGETRTYSFEAITTAIRLIEKGARFIATNPDVSGPSVNGPIPATGSVAALITKATGVEPYFVGKPNPLMMRSALNRIDAHSETTVMVGDRMDTDVVSGLEAGLRTILVLTGSTRPEQVERFPYRPTHIVDSVADIVDLVDEWNDDAEEVVDFAR